jgi:hypothetical protein
VITLGSCHRWAYAFNALVLASNIWWAARAWSSIEVIFPVALVVINLFLFRVIGEERRSFKEGMSTESQVRRLWMTLAEERVRVAELCERIEKLERVNK